MGTPSQAVAAKCLPRFSGAADAPAERVEDFPNPYPDQAGKTRLPYERITRSMGARPPKRKPYDPTSRKENTHQRMTAPETGKQPNMNKEETIDYLRERGIEVEVTEHQAVYNMAELDSVDLPYPDRDAKNLFVRDDKKRNYYLISIKDDKRIDLKEFRKAQGLRSLSFASADDLAKIMDLTPGSVSPLGILNDEERKVTFFLDEAFKGGLVGVHPNDNTATIWLDADALMHIVEEHGNEARYVNLR